MSTASLVLNVHKIYNVNRLIKKFAPIKYGHQRACFLMLDKKGKKQQVLQNIPVLLKLMTLVRKHY